MSLTKQPLTSPLNTEGGARINRRSAAAVVRHIDRSVRDLPLNVKLKSGQIIVEQGACGVAFSFPAVAWPNDVAKQYLWIQRLTPWWDMDAPDWTPQARRLRESCVKAINSILFLC